MKAMCPPDYHYYGFVVTYVLGFMKAIVVISGWAHCFHDCIYITPILLL